MMLNLCLLITFLGQPDPVGLDEAELLKRRDFLSTWAHEPVALEAQAFLFHLDRRDGSFFLQDRRTQMKWFSPWGRRGFASVRLQGEEVWRPLEKLGGLVAQSQRLRFRVFSADPAGPSLRFTIEPHANARGLVFSYEVAAADVARVARVRIFDGAFWIADADPGGGAVVAAGAGERHTAVGAVPFRRRLDGYAPFAPRGLEPYTIPLIGLFKQENPVLVSWSDAAAAVELERRAVVDEKFPGHQLLSTTLEMASPRGQAEVFLLGKDQGGILDTVRGYRDLLGPTFFERSLRYKTGTRPETRALLSAALLHCELGPGRTLADVTSLSQRLKRELRIDDAAFIVAAGAAKGVELKAASDAIKAEGHLLGVEVALSDWVKLASDGLRQAAATSSAGFWQAALEGARQDGACLDLVETCAPHVLVVKEPQDWPPEMQPEAAAEARRDCLRYLRDTAGLLGLQGASGVDTEYASMLLGILSRPPNSPVAASSWPVFAATFGQCARLTVRPDDAVRPDQPGRILEHLLLGEVPFYALAETAAAPLPGRDDPALCFARDDGWSKGKGLSPREIFLKNTHEILAHVARQRFRDPLFLHNLLTPSGSARESYFGADLRVVVNFGPGNYEDSEEGFLLPPNGFFVRHPFFRAFHALRMNDAVYETPACIVMHSLEGKMILRAEQVRLYHAFGPNHVQFGGRSFTIDREAVVKF